MHCLVTGGAGFIGSHLCDALIARGYAVHCVDNFSRGRRENVSHLDGHEAFQFAQMDVLDKEALDRVFARASFDAVFHLAGNSDIPQGTQDHTIDLRHTFLTTYEVLEAMLRHNVGRVVFASTSAIFGEIDTPLSEEHGPVRPTSFYGASKLAAEAYLSVYANNYGVHTQILRFPNVVGSRATHGIIRFFIGRLQRDPKRLTVLGDGTQAKPYGHVSDVVRAILLVFDNAKGPLDVFHVGSLGVTTVREIAAMVVEEMGLTGIPIEYTSATSAMRGDVHHFSYDMTKIRSLGFTPRFDSSSAIRQAIRDVLREQVEGQNTKDKEQLP